MTMTAPQMQRRLDELPPELLRQICEYTLPQGLAFSFPNRHRPWSKDPIWRLCAAEPGEQPLPVYCSKPWSKTLAKCDPMCPIHIIADEMHTALLYVNKTISTEARATLYKGNVFRVYINAKPHRTSSLASPLIFGPFGHAHRIHLLRDFRRIRISFDIDDEDTYGLVRLRARMQHFVDTINQHGGDAARKSLLKGLHVRMLLHGHNLRYNKRCRYIQGRSKQRVEEGNRCVARHMFALEPLVELHPLTEVEVVGCPEWFMRCLLMRLRGEGGPLRKLVWPVKSAKRRKGDKQYKVVLLSTRKRWQPVYDWADFAERNGVQLPDEAAEFFP